jgi:hypothetical protein
MLYRESPFSPLDVSVRKVDKSKKIKVLLPKGHRGWFFTSWPVEQLLTPSLISFFPLSTGFTSPIPNPT